MISVANIDRETRLLNAIHNQLYKVNLLIDDTLDMTRIQIGQFEPRIRHNVDLVAVLQRIVAQQAEITAEHVIRLETEQESLFGQFDETRIEQVLKNLIGNAFKYSDIGKPVTVGLEKHTLDNSSSEVVIWVRDEGYGITEDHKADVFQRLYRVQSGQETQVKGTGLGLYISREIVARYGGRMWLESKPGVGSTFYFSLPIQQ